VCKIKNMATAQIPQSVVSFDPNSGTIDNKEPIATELPVDDFAQQVSELLPPKVNNVGSDPVLRSSSQENGVLGTADMSAPSLSASDNDTPATPQASPPTTPEQSLPSTPEAYLPSISATLNLDTDITLSERSSQKLALQILNVIQRYGHKNGSGSDVAWAGKQVFLPLVEEAVEKGAPIKMVLPAFPCKSTNKVEKVIGTLPDLGEELALTHLNGLCESITDIYEHGAEVVITSDGLVYNGNTNLCHREQATDFE